MLLLRDYGTMRLADVLAPAIGYARNGYPLVERASATIDTVKDLFREHWPTSAAVYMPGRQSAGARHACSPMPRMADTYARILREAESAGGNREAQIERARKILVARLRRRGDRQILPHAGGDGYLAASAIAACSTADDMARLAGRASSRRSTLRLRPTTR